MNIWSVRVFGSNIGPFNPHSGIIVKQYTLQIKSHVVVLGRIKFTQETIDITRLMRSIIGYVQIHQGWWQEVEGRIDYFNILLADIRIILYD